MSDDRLIADIDEALEPDYDGGMAAGRDRALLERCRTALSAQPAEPKQRPGLPKWRPIPKRGEPVELTSGPLQPLAAEPKQRRAGNTPLIVGQTYDPATATRMPAAEPKSTPRSRQRD